MEKTMKKAVKAAPVRKLLNFVATELPSVRNNWTNWKKNSTKVIIRASVPENVWQLKHAFQKLEYRYQTIGFFIIIITRRFMRIFSKYSKTNRESKEKKVETM